MGARRVVLFVLGFSIGFGFLAVAIAFHPLALTAKALSAVVRG